MFFSRYLYLLIHIHKERDLLDCDWWENLEILNQIVDFLPFYFNLNTIKIKYFASI